MRYDAMLAGWMPTALTTATLHMLAEYHLITERNAQKNMSLCGLVTREGCACVKGIVDMQARAVSRASHDRSGIKDFNANYKY
jgi:hypothetical protein